MTQTSYLRLFFYMTDITYLSSDNHADILKGGGTSYRPWSKRKRIWWF